MSEAPESAPPPWLARAFARPGRLALALLLPALLLALPALRTRFGGTLLDLLPDRPVARALARAVEAVGSADVDLVLVDAPSGPEAARAAEALAARLRREDTVADASERLLAATAPDARQLWEALARRADARTLEALRARFGPQGAQDAVARIVALAQAPGGGPALREQLTRDPYDLAPLLAERMGHLGAALRPDAEGALVSNDGRARLVLLRGRGAPFDMAYNERLAAALARGLESAQRASPGAQVRWTGPHAIALATRDLLRADLQRSSVLASVLVTLVLLLALRRVRALVAVGLPLALGTAWTMSFATVALRGLNAITVAFAAVVLGVGLDTGVHLYDRLLRERAQGRSGAEAATRALWSLGGAVLTAALTAAAAFASLLVSELRALRELGLLAAAGELLTAVALVALTPALGALLEGGDGPRQEPRDGLLARAAGALAGARATPAVVALVALGALGSMALWRAPALGDAVVVVRPSALAPLAVQSEVFARFGGEPGQWLLVAESPALEGALELSEDLEARLEPLQREGVLAGFDTVSALAPSLRAQRERAEALRAMDLAGAATRLEAALGERGARTELFSEGLAPLRAGPPSARASSPLEGAGSSLARRFLARRESGAYTVVAYVRPARGVAHARVRAAVEGATRGLAVQLTGYPLLEADVRSALQADGARVGGLALALVTALLALGLRRARLVALALAGVGVQVLALFALVGALRVPLDAYNLLAVPVLLGISLDEIVFVLHAMEESVGTPAERARRAVRSMAPATTATAMATAAGFGALLVCRFEALRGLGLLAAVGTVLGWASALAVVPALGRVFAAGPHPPAPPLPRGRGGS